MEKQRCARAAALSGKSLDCPGCNDPNQECNLHQCTGTTVQSTTGSGRRVQATKSEAHTTTSGRPSGGHNRSSHKRMLQHRIHENNNQFYKTNDRYNPQGSYSQVSSTTGDHQLHAAHQQHHAQHRMDHVRHHPQGQVLIPQCGKFRIFLSHRFYVKSILVIVEVQNLLFYDFQRA